MKSAAVADASRLSETARRRRAALLSSAAMAAGLLLLQPRAAYAQNTNCTTSGDTVTCEDNTDGIDQETQNLIVDNVGTNIASPDLPAETIGILVDNSADGDIEILADLTGASVITHNASGVVVSNFDPDGAVTLDFTGDIEVTGDVGTGGNNPGQYLYGAFISTDAAGTVDATLDGTVAVTTDDGPTSLGAKGIAVSSGGGVTLTATGDVVVESGVGDSTAIFFGYGYSGDVYGIDVSPDVGSVTINASGTISATSGDGIGSFAGSGQVFGVRANADDGDVFLTLGDVEAKTGAANSSYGTAYSGTATGISTTGADGEVTIEVDDLKATSGNATGAIGVTRSGNVFGADITASAAVAGEGLLSFTSRDVYAASGVAQSSGGDVDSGGATGVDLSADETYGMNVDALTGDVTVYSGDAVSQMRYAESGSASGVDIETGAGTATLGVSGDVTVKTGLANGEYDAFSGDAFGVDVDTDEGDAVLSLGNVTATSGAASAGYGSAFSGDATGVDSSSGDGYGLVEAGVVTVTSGAATSVEIGARSGNAVGLEVDEAASLSLTATSVTAISGDVVGVTEASYYDFDENEVVRLPTQSGEAVGISAISDGAITATTDTVIATSGTAASNAGTNSGDATGIGFYSSGGSVDLSALGAVSVSSGLVGTALAPSESARSGNVVGIDVYSSSGGADVTANGDITVRTGAATGLVSALSGLSGATGIIIDAKLATSVESSGDILVRSGTATVNGTGVTDVDGDLSAIARSASATGIDAFSSDGPTTIRNQGGITATSGGVTNTPTENATLAASNSGSATAIEASARNDGDVLVENDGNLVATSGDVMQTRTALSGDGDPTTLGANLIYAGSVAGIDVEAGDDGEPVSGSASVVNTGDIEVATGSVTLGFDTFYDDDEAFATAVVGPATGIAVGAYGGGIEVENSGDIVATAGTAAGRAIDGNGVAQQTVYSGRVRGISVVASASSDANAQQFAGGDVDIVTTGDVAADGGATQNRSGSFNPGLEGSYGPETQYVGISAAIFATSEAGNEYEEAAGSAGIAVDGASVTAYGTSVNGIFASSAQSTVILVNGASVTANGAGANGIIVGPQFFDSSQVGGFGVASSQHLVVVGEGTSLVSEEGAAILDVEAFSVTSPPPLLRVVAEAEPQGPLFVASAPNDTTVRIAGAVRGGSVDGSGTAVSFQGGDDMAVIEPGYDVTGLVDGGEGFETNGDVFALGGMGTETFDISLVDGDGTPGAGEQYVDFESFQKQGSSTFFLTGDNGEIQTLPVLGGGLFVLGNVNAAFPVSSGATLGGTGTVGSLTALSGSTIAPGIPGDVPGTFSANGDATFEDDSSLEVTIAADNSNDLLIVGGATTINGGTIRVAPAAGTVPDGRNYTIISSAGGVSGEFDEVIDNLPDIELTDVYLPGSVLLGFRADSGGPTPQVPAGPDPEMPGGPDPEAPAEPNPEVPDEPSPEMPGAPTPTVPDGPIPEVPGGSAPEMPDGDRFSEKANALAAVVGAGNAAMNFSETLSRRAGLTGSGPNILIAPLGYDDTDRRMRILSTGGFTGANLAIAARASAPLVAPSASLGGLAMWVGGLSEHRDIDAKGSARGYESDSNGLAAGLEYRLVDGPSQAVFGLAEGYTRSDVSVIDGGAAVDGGHIGLYAGYISQTVRLTGALSYSVFDYDLDRQTAGFGGSGSADGDAFSGHAQAFYNLNAAQTVASGLEYGPVARVRGVYADRDGFDESGLGILNLSFEDDSISQFYGAIGGRVAATYTFSSMILSPELEVSYERNFADNAQSGVATLTALGGRFPVDVTNGSKNLFAIGAGIGAQFTDTLSGHVRYDGSFGDGYASHRGSLGLSLEF